MPLARSTRDKLASVGTARIAAALAKRALRRQSLSGLRPLSPVQDVLIGEASTALETCVPGSVLVVEAGTHSIPVALLIRRRVAGVLCGGPLRNAADIARTGLPAYQTPADASPRALPIEAGDVVFGDRTGIIVIPGHLVDTVAEEADEAAAYEAFIAEQVDAGGGVYGLHIPSGEQARQAFAEWRRMRGR